MYEYEKEGKNLSLLGEFDAIKKAYTPPLPLINYFKNIRDIHLFS